MTKLYCRASSLDSDSAIPASDRTSYPVSMMSKWPSPLLKGTFIISRGHFTLKRFPQPERYWDAAASMEQKRAEDWMAQPGRPQMGWESSAEHPPESLSTHQMSSTLYTGRRIVFIEYPQRAAHTGWIQLGVRSSRRAPMGVEALTCYLLLASEAAPPGATTEGAQPAGACLILDQEQLEGGFPFWSGMNAGVICVYYLYPVSQLPLTLLYPACFPSISVKQCITFKKKPTGWALFLGLAAPNISNTVSYIHL